MRTGALPLTQLTNESQLVLLARGEHERGDAESWIDVVAYGVAIELMPLKRLIKVLGCLNLALTSALLKLCAYTHEEPWLQLPKSALWSRYQLSNGEQLAVVNIHAVNFTLGTEEYLYNSCRH